MNVSSLEPTELLVSWIFDDNETSHFEVMWSPPNEMAENSSTTSDTSYTITDLTPCTNYTVYVLAMHGNTALASTAKETTMTARPASDVSSVAVDTVANQPSQLDVSWWTEEDPGNCSNNFSVTWGSLDGVPVGEAFTAAMEYTIVNLEALTPYNVCVANSLSDLLGCYPVCGVNTTVEGDADPKTHWVIPVSVTLVILVAAGVCIYVFRDKLRRLRPRRTSFGSSSRHGHSTSEKPQVNTAAGEVRTTDIRSYIKSLEEDTQRGLEDEFELLWQQSGQHPVLVATESVNKPKNRFRNILPFDHSRVTLPRLEGDPSSDYINANYIKDAEGRQLFVACQGPTASTVGDFWRLVWHVDARVVVMLTNVRERGRERCALYWPTPEQPNITCGDVTVRHRGEEGSEDLRVREFLVLKGEEERQVKQYHHTTWPDFGVPPHEHHLLDLLSEVRDAAPRGSPIVVHCSAGVGRTGTFIGLWNLMDTVDSEQPASINVQETVLAMRECRSKMVQTPEQYLYLYKCIAAYLEEPTKWRRNVDLGLSGAPAPEACQDSILAFDNPAFSEEGCDGGPSS